MDRAGTSSGTMFGPGIYLAENVPRQGLYFFLCVSVSNILAFPDSQDMPFEFNLGQQER